MLLHGAKRTSYLVIVTVIVTGYCCYRSRVYSHWSRLDYNIQCVSYALACWVSHKNSK